MNFKRLLTTIFAVLSATVLTVVSGCALFGSLTGAPLTVSAENIQIEVGESIVLTTNSKSEVIWLSENEKVAKVSADGKVTGVGEGETSIIAVSENMNAACTVKVIFGKYSKEGYALVWHDEFEGNSLSADNWEYQYGVRDYYGDSKGPVNWGNNELQYYREENAAVEDGALIITAQREEEAIEGKDYTSSRISTRDRFSCTYGYVEARIKAPAVSGMWPAFWMLPQPVSNDRTGNEYGGWPSNGEIDIMEIKGRLPQFVDTTLHFGGGGGNHQYKGATTLLDSSVENWHIYAIDWTAEYIAWLIDGTEVFRMTNDQWWSAAVDNSENPSAPYDKPFYILLNLAVGGNYDPTGTRELEDNEDFTSANMYVDYVRVYEKIV